MNLDSARESATSGGSAGDEISLKDLIGILWQGKWLIILVTGVMTTIAIVAAFMVEEKFEAVVLLSPVTEEGSGLSGAGSLLSQFGGLASLAGVSLSADSKKTESVAILRSGALAERYIVENNLVPVLFADEWDAQQKRWTTDDPKEAPTPWKARELFRKKVRKVTEESKSGLITLTVTWTDPDVAAQWANGLVKMTNDYTREKAIRQAEQNIAFLNDQVAKTSVVEVQKAIFSLIETEIKKMMLARGNDEYALKVLDPGVPPEKRSSPVRAIWAAAGLFGGFFLAVFLVFARAAWRAQDE